MDDANPKKPKALTARQRFKNLMDGLAEDALNDTTPLTTEELEEAERVKQKLLKSAGDEVYGEGWQKKAEKRKAETKKKFIN